MMDYGCFRAVVKGDIGKGDGCDTPYVKDVTKMLRKQVLLCGKNDITFREDYGNTLSRAASPSTTTNYIRTYFEEVKEKVMGSHNSSDMRIGKIDGNTDFFVGFV